jgi:hypothetical protein
MKKEKGDAFMRKNVDFFVASLPGNFESINSHQFTFLLEKTILHVKTLNFSLLV